MYQICNCACTKTAHILKVSEHMIIFLPVCCLLINCIGKPTFIEANAITGHSTCFGHRIFVFQQDSALLTEPRKLCTVNDWDTCFYSAYIVASELPGPQFCWLLCLECATITCLQLHQGWQCGRLKTAHRGWMDSVIASAIAQWHLRLHACVLAAGGHFEHCLHWNYPLFM